MNFTPPFVNPTNRLPNIQMAPPVSAHSWHPIPVPIVTAPWSSITSSQNAVQQARQQTWNSQLYSDRKKTICKRRYDENTSDATSSKVFINEEHMALRMRALSIDNNNVDAQPNLEDSWYVDGAGNHTGRPTNNNHSMRGNIATEPAAQRQIHTNNSRSPRSALAMRSRQALEDLENRLDDADSDFDIEVDDELAGPRLEFSETLKECQKNIRAKEILPKVVLDNICHRRRKDCMDLVLWKPPSATMHPQMPAPPAQTVPPDVIKTYQSPKTIEDLSINTESGATAAAPANDNQAFNIVDFGSQMNFAASVPLPPDDEMEL